MHFSNYRQIATKKHLYHDGWRIYTKDYVWIFNYYIHLIKEAMTYGKVSSRWLNNNGEVHRDNGPAIVLSNGDTYYYKNGEIHRDYAPAVITRDYACYWQNGEKHRDGGPAEFHWVKYGGTSYAKNITTKVWYKHGKIHCESGYAIEYSDEYGWNYSGRYCIEGDVCSFIDILRYKWKKFRKQLK